MIYIPINMIKNAINTHLIQVHENYTVITLVESLNDN